MGCVSVERSHTITSVVNENGEEIQLPFGIELKDGELDCLSKADALFVVVKKIVENINNRMEV